jgi:hypothetical protein
MVKHGSISDILSLLKVMVVIDGITPSGPIEEGTPFTVSCTVYNMSVIDKKGTVVLDGASPQAGQANPIPVSLPGGKVRSLVFHMIAPRAGHNKPIDVYYYADPPQMVGEFPQPESEAHKRVDFSARFQVTLKHCHVTYMRSYGDNLVLACAAQVGQTNKQTDKLVIGRVNSGDDRDINITFGPFTLVPSLAPSLIFDYTIVNIDPGDAQQLVDFLDGVSDITKQVLDVAYPLGPVWGLVDALTKYINDALFGGDCRGIVVADRIDIPSSQLEWWGTHDETRDYPGSPAPFICSGVTASDYQLTWEVKRLSNPNA